jgi:chromosome partitioning protein
LIDYLLQETQSDPRYELANYLLSADRIDNFDITLIDAPPRLTAGAINAFCASTHLLVPTLYDRLSAEAVGTFLNGVTVLKDALNPSIDLLGIVGMLSQRSDLVVREENAKRTAMNQVMQTWGPNYYFFERHIPRRAAIAAAAGEDLAYIRDETVRSWFDALGEEISSRLDLRINLKLVPKSLPEDGPEVPTRKVPEPV